MTVSSNGGAMPEYVSLPLHAKHPRQGSPHKEFLAELDFNCRFTRNAKKLVSRNFALEFPASNISHVDQAKAVQNCMRSVTGNKAVEVAAVIIATLIDDVADGECLPSLTAGKNPAELSWSRGLDCILEAAPWYVGDCIDDTRLHSGSYGLTLMHSCMSAWITREGCAWLIEEKGFPRVSNPSQALMYLISGNSCHNQIGRGCFTKQPDRAKPRSWWSDRHPQLPFFYGAQNSYSDTDLLASAFAD